MEKKNLAEMLKNNAYPGRGIVIGLDKTGENAVVGYFIMGRSENSRNRVFTAVEGGIITEAADPAKLSDPENIIYAPVKTIDGKTIVTNGNQTDTIYDFIKDCGCFTKALRTRQFENDAPNYTPRISGIVLPDAEGGFRYKLSILKSDNGNGDACLRYFYDYATPIKGEGRFIHTYIGDGSPIPSFEGEPVRVTIDGDIESFSKTIWESLNADNKVAFFARFINLKSGKITDKIINKFEKK